MICYCELIVMMQNILREGPNSSNTDLLADKLKLLFHLINNDNYPVAEQDYAKLNRVLEKNGKTAEEVFENISPSCRKLLKKCMWKGEDKRCDSLFEKIKTSLGYCCSFNYFALKNNTYSVANLLPTKMAKNPRRTSSCGFQSGLEVLIDNDPDDYFATHIPSTGFRILIHNPYDFPDWAITNVLCEMNSNNLIGINPEIISATKNIKSRSIPERNCLFPNEKNLDNFARYSYHNCMVECKMLLTLEFCRCIPFYLYNEAGTHGSANVCTLKDIPCIAKNEHLMYNISFMKERQMEKDGKCYCLPNCESASYNPEASKGILDASYCTNQFSIYSGMNLENHTVIRIFFNDLLGTRHRRDVIFTWHTLMGYYGGILGLFTGFSFFSVVEIIYFSIIRCLTDVTNTKIENQCQDKIVTKFGPRKFMRTI